MKLRIKGNSIRIRLTKTEVSMLAETGYLEEHTSFLNNQFIYALQKADEIETLSASFENNKITIFAPAGFINEWPVNNVIGLNTNMALSATEFLYLLIEKDFICLDETTEDQSDNYENPNKNC
jgi:hypothetical protein